MRAPFMAGEFPFPVKYGYSSVGRVERGPAELLDKLVFSLSPHQTLLTLAADAVALLPLDVPPARAVLAANMETALNAVWDAEAGPADRIAIVGGGVVGMLVAFLCGHLPGAEVTLVDINVSRKSIANGLGVKFATPDQAPTECDVVIHCSGAPQGLVTALSLAGEEATVLEMSWYGDQPVTVNLGGAFHSRQIRLQSSQVGHVSASRRPRWNYARRLSAALALLNDARLDVLLAPAVLFNDLPAQLPKILGPGNSILCQLIQYD
jgi:threonine dehydrogenase-like Zn-dependent dehydrogenase